MTNVQEGWKADKCRIFDLSDKKSDLNEVKTMFNIKNQQELDNFRYCVDQKFENTEVNW